MYQEEISKLANIAAMSSEEMTHDIDAISSEFISISDVKDKLSSLLSSSISTLSNISNISTANDNSTRSYNKILRHVSKSSVVEKDDKTYVKIGMSKTMIPGFVKIGRVVVRVPSGASSNLVIYGSGLIDLSSKPEDVIGILSRLYTKSISILNSETSRSSSRPTESITDDANAISSMFKDFITTSNNASSDYATMSAAYGNHNGIVKSTGYMHDIARSDLVEQSAKVKKLTDEISTVVQQMIKRNDNDKLESISKVVLVDLLNDIKAATELVSYIGTTWYMSYEYVNAHYNNLAMIHKKY